jgi:predicted enzyme related to lactoylglutathione lyase
VDYSSLIRKLLLPPGFLAPTRLTYEDLVARALSRTDLADDVRGINESLELIRRTRGGGWPEEAVTEEFNYVDLVGHEQEFRERTSFAYAVYDSAGGYLGCCYLYPMGRRTELSEELLHHDVDVSWWVTPEAYERGYYEKLYQALRHWIVEQFPFDDPYYSNAEMPGLHAHHSIDYIEIAVDDVEAAKAFYGTAFGWSFADYGSDYAGIRIGGQEVGGLTSNSDVRAGGPLVILYSDDLEASVESVTTAGGTILKPIYSFPGGRRFHFADPAGNELAVWSELSP